MARIKVDIPEDTHRALVSLAARERRPAADQAAYLLIRALARQHRPPEAASAPAREPER